MLKYLTFLLTFQLISAHAALGLETINVVLTSKAFQYVPVVIAQERGYMKEEGIELKFVYMQNAPGLYDDLISTFTKGGYVDEETQKNDLAIVKLVAEVNEVVPPQKAYDFSFVRQAEQQLNKQGWKP